MTYLFWAFAAVWIAIVLYLHGLMRRTQALAREIDALRAQASKRRPEAVPAARAGAERP